MIKIYNNRFAILSVVDDDHGDATTIARRVDTPEPFTLKSGVVTLGNQHDHVVSPFYVDKEKVVRFDRGTPKFQCRFCDPVEKFTYHVDLKLHEANCHPFCLQCDIAFKHNDDIAAHLVRERHAPRAVRCVSGDCPRKFVNLPAAVQHIEAGTCPSEVKSDDILMWIIGNDPESLLIDSCALMEHLKKSVVTVVDGSDDETVVVDATNDGSPISNSDAFGCTICNKSFPLLRSLKAHMASPVHDPRIYRCPRGDCTRTFQTLSSLLQHIDKGRCGAKYIQSPMKDAIRKELMIARAERVKLHEPDLYKRALRAAYPTIVARANGQA